MRYLRAFFGAGLILLLGVMLLATIYFTLFDLQWIAFLAGVLFAAVAAIASQTSRAQWLLLRCTKQLQRVKDLLAKENLGYKHAVEALAHANERFQVINDALPVMMVFVDRDERCHYHNHAFTLWCKRGSDRIGGLLLRNVVSDEAYRELKPKIDDVLDGNECRCEADLEQPDGEMANCTITLLPFPPESKRPDGFYALIARSASIAAPAMHPRAHLVQALREDQFILFAQTIRSLDASTPYPRLVEVLLRLQEEEDYMEPPGGFFPVAERYNLMPEIDRWVVRHVIEWAQEKERSDPARPMPIYCVNIASASLRDPEFALYVQHELQERKFPAANLCFEITELDVINQHAAVEAFMRAMRPLGCLFAVDDFGSIRGSFELPGGLTLDFLKIDGTIVQGMMIDPAELVRAKVIALASHKLGIRTIAEFAETDETIAKLREIGVDYAQGFGISRPGPIADL